MQGETATDCNESASSPRRSIMPSIYSDKETKRKKMKNQSPSFSPYARVLAIESQKDLSEEEKNDIWWQKSDYEEFRKGTTKLVQTMMNENLHGWLGCKKDEPSTSAVVPLLPVASNEQQSPPKRHMPPKRTVDEQENLHHISQKAKRETNDDSDESPAMSWWDRFGDLAHFHESRRRQTEVSNSVKLVLEEQRRQKMFQTFDPTKTRITYIQATSWARDWALALATANAADVLRNSGSDTKEKESIASSLFAAKNALSAALSRPKAQIGTATNRLDANTSSQILFRQVRSREEVVQRRLARRLAASQGSTTSTDSKSNGNEESSKTTEVALAKKAAGFGADICPKAAMTALLSR